MKKKLVRLFTDILIALLLLVVIFLAYSFYYYSDSFSYNTWVNDVYCTGKSVSEVNDILKEKTEFGTVSYTNDYYLNKSESYQISEIVSDFDYTDELKLLSLKNRLFWFLNDKEFGKSIYIEPDVHFDEKILKEKITSLNEINNYITGKERLVEIRKDEEAGFYLYEELTPLISVEKLLSLTLTNLNKENIFKELVISISDDVFIEPEITDEMKKAYSEWAAIESYLETKVIYDMGDEIIPIDGKVLSSFVTFKDGEFLKDSDNNILIDDAAVCSYLDKLFDKYDTYKKPRTYKTLNGEIKEINLSVYGTEINRTKEKDYLVNAIHSGISETHIPAYSHEPYHRGLNDIGPEFIEVDITNQKLYYVKDNVIIMETDVVTGRPSMGRDTPEVVAFVYRKQKKAVLRGEDYVSPVDYWMPIYKGIGLHDANWQAKFGGDWYLKHGSHGCINMRPKDAKELFEQIEVGIPVIVYK